MTSLYTISLLCNLKTLGYVLCMVGAVGLFIRVLVSVDLDEEPGPAYYWMKRTTPIWAAVLGTGILLQLLLPADWYLKYLAEHRASQTEQTQLEDPR